MDVLTDWMRITGVSGAILARSRLCAPWGMRLQRHQEMAFHTVLEGTCWLRYAGASPLALHPGDLVLLPHGLEHELVHHPQGTSEPLERLLARPPVANLTGQPCTLLCGVYCSDTHLAQPMLQALPELVSLSAAQVQASPSLSGVLTLLISELDAPGPGSETVVQHLFDALFLYLMRTWADSATGRPGLLLALRDPALARALGRMHAEPAFPWTVDRLAHEASLSRAAFARRFTQELGEAPLAYLTRWRMGLAARMLLEHQASVAEVATRVGYDSEFAFSRAFKRARGIAPGAFRKSQARA